MSNRHITSVPGLFGETIHYDESGVKVGESWPGLFNGSMVHYGADGSYAGRSDPGLFAEFEHYDADGSHLGSTYHGLLNGMHVHYSDNDGYVGDTLDGLVSSDTDFDF